MVVMFTASIIVSYFSNWSQ